MVNKKDCKEKIVKRKKGDASYFEESDKRFKDNPFEICVNKEKTKW